MATRTLPGNALRKARMERDGAVKQKIAIIHAAIAHEHAWKHASQCYACNVNMAAGPKCLPCLRRELAKLEKMLRD